MSIAQLGSKHQPKPRANLECLSCSWPWVTEDHVSAYINWTNPRSCDWGFILSKFCNIIIHVYLTLINMFIILQNYAKFSSNYTTSMSIQLNGNYSIFYIAVFGRRIYLPIGMNFGKLHRVSVIFPFWGIWVCRQFMQTFLWRSV